MKTNIRRVVSAIAGLTLVASMMLASSVSADTGNSAASRTPGQGRGNFPAGMPGNRGEIKNGMKPVVVGNVTAVNGNSITVTSRQGGPRPTTGETAATPTPVVYTVDATNAVVKKNNATSTVASIAVGDMVMIQGTVSGTNVVATNIRDNVAGPHNSTGNGNENGGPRNSSSTAPAFVGNGQPVVAGKLVTVSGNSLTVTTASNITYTVDATSAKVLKGQSATTVSSLVIGDTVLVQGTVSGTSVTAATIIDRTNTTPVAGGTTAGAAENKQGGGFFSGIGQFFMHMFGF